MGTNKVQILLPLAKQIHWDELRYAIRSWEKQLGSKLEIFTVGEVQPNFLKNRHPHLMASPSKINRWASIAEALVKASEDPRLADEFILMNDDFYLMGSYDTDANFYEGSLADKIGSLNQSGYNSYRESLKATEDILRKLTGKETLLNFETHTPMVLTATELQAAAFVASNSSTPLQMRSLAANLSGPSRVWVELESDVKVRDSGPVLNEWPHLLLSSQDNLFDRVEPLLKKAFPEPAKVELASFEGDHWADLGGTTWRPELPEEWFSHPGMKPFNPSLIWFKGALLMSVRYSFFWHPGLELTPEEEAEVILTKKTAGKYGVSHTILCELDPAFESVVWWKQLEPKKFPDFHANKSLEDVRLFEDGGSLYGIGVFLHQGTENHEQAVARISPKAGTFTWRSNLGKPNGHTEKNWSPIEGESGKFQYSPTETWAGVIDGEPYKGSIHGGTQLLKLEDGSHLSVVHNFVKRQDETMIRPERHYVHYLARWVDGVLVELSDGFVFEWEKPIEFASGLTWADSSKEAIVVSYGVGDSDLGLASISLFKALDSLKPYNPKEERQVVKS